MDDIVLRACDFHFPVSGQKYLLIDRAVQRGPYPTPLCFYTSSFLVGVHL